MLDGKYTFTANTPMGAKPGTLTLATAEDGTLTGEVEILGGTFEIKGTADGDTCKFVTTIKAFGRPFRFDGEGKLADGVLDMVMKNPMATVTAKASPKNTTW